MTLPEALELFDYWQNSPPEHELLAILTRAYTNWEPVRQMTEEECQIEHRKSLEMRWKAGAMNPKQLFEATGGVIRLDGAGGAPPDKLPGIGPFPGMVH